MSASARRVRAFCGALLALVVLLVAGVASGAAARSTVVVVILPPLPETDLAEAYVRMQAELRAAGFEVKPTAGRPELEPASALAAVAQELQPAAVIAIFENPSGALEFWVLDARNGRTALKRLARGSDPKRAPEILAISAVELLLASLAELDIKPDASAAEVAQPTPAPAPAPATRRTGTKTKAAAEPHWGLELGAGAALSGGGVGAAWLPAARLEWAPLPLLRARLSGLGLGTHPQVTGPGGVASTSQAIVLTEVVLRPWPRWQFAPQFSLGSGAYYFRIKGQGTQGAAGRTASQWSAAMDAGLGLSWKLERHFELVFEAHALLAQPYPSIRFFGAEQATAGRPTWVLTAMAAGWL